MLHESTSSRAPWPEVQPDIKRFYDRLVANGKTFFPQERGEWQIQSV
jgi:hypothetical protein